LRSSLSPEGGSKSKWYFRAETGTFFKKSCILGAYYMKSYKKLNQKAQNLEITPFTMGIRPKIVIICEKSVFFLKTQFACDFHNIEQI
jgi:hypothetical protein